MHHGDLVLLILLLVSATYWPTGAVDESTGHSDWPREAVVSETGGIRSARDGAASCVFDAIKPQHTPTTVVDYQQRLDDRRWKRNAAVSPFRPIRITPYFVNIEEELSREEQASLKDVVREAVDKITQLFSVVPVRGPLVLSREDSCRSVFMSGPNKLKCGLKTPVYKGEKCARDVDDFRIPENHLEELYIYNRTWGAPLERVFARGSGVQDSDFILYIYSSMTPTCTTKHIIAYAVYCRRDQYGRPIAGFVNFCPDHLKPSSFNKDRAELTAIHELFHALGFSKDMFRNYQNCSVTVDGKDCQPWNKVVKVDSANDVVRLATPGVVKAAQEHFSCDDEDYGGTLEIKEGDYGSHWDPRVMYSSIMAPELGAGHLTFIDGMTLAAFEDSGWYKVNYSIADSYRWGKGQGCRFGLKKYCSSDENSYFCTGKKHGCHYTHKDRGVCHTDSFLSPCRVYKSDKENACVNGFHEHHADRVHLEVYGDQSKCFMSNITSLKAENASELVGRCFEHRCLDIRTLQVKVDHEWYSCPDVGYLEVSVYRGVMLCPDAEILCHDFTNQTATTQLLPTTEQTTVITDYPLHVMTRFDRDIDDINTRSFIIGYRDAVSQITGIRSSRIVNGHITGDSLRFFLLPADNVSDTLMSRDAVVKLEQAVKEQRLRVELGLDTFTAIYIGDADLASEHATVAPLSGAAIACIVVIIVALLVIVNGILLVKLRVINLQKLRDRLLRKPPPTTHVNGNAFKMNGV